MNKEEIKDFLRLKPGYLKEGGRRLKEVLNRKGLTASKNKCKDAIREVNQEMSIRPFNSTSEDSEPKILFYDIETSYGIAKAWRPTYKGIIRYDDFIVHPKIICVSFKWSNEDKVSTYHWGEAQDDKALVDLFIEQLNKADFIVAHNGDKFDLPWIRTRALKHGIPMYPKYTSVDTLKIARYQHNFPSNRLNDLGDYLGLGEKLKTDMSLWDRIILHKDAEALDYMIDYCEQDVLLLEKVYNKLSQMTLPTIHKGTLDGKSKLTSPYTGKNNFEYVGKSTTKAGTIKRLMKDLDTDKYFEMSNSVYKKYKAISE